MPTSCPTGIELVANCSMLLLDEPVWRQATTGFNGFIASGAQFLSFIGKLIK
jgi:hypothetical protein